jgi:hypothetical protein
VSLSLNNNGMEVDPVVAASASPVSSLDTRERLVRVARESGGYGSESEEEFSLEEVEEGRRVKLTVVGSVLPSQVRLSPGKAALMGALGLTTLKRKKGGWTLVL